MWIVDLLINLFSSLYGFIFSYHHELWKYDLEDLEILDSNVPNKEVFILSDSGFVPLTATHIKKKYKLYNIKTKDFEINCADEHMIYTKFGYSKFVKDMEIGEPLVTKNGVQKIEEITKSEDFDYTFDCTVASVSKLYYSDGFLSHNSITSGIFIAWYLLTNYERNVMIVSENGDKVEELMDKIDVIMRGLPFYMKLGVITNNVYTKVFDNKCKLKAQKTTENTGASFTIHLLYADEFALVNQKFLGKFYRTVYPTLSSSEISRMIITSTPRGMNKFYEIYEGAINSENLFNPIRTDWYEVPLQDDKGNVRIDEKGNILYRDEKWKNEQIKQLGSEEDFNQEFGNQFLAGNALLLTSTSLKKMKHHEIEFIHQDLKIFDDMELENNFIDWHPNFELENLRNESCRFVHSIDLGSGIGADHSVNSFSQILPMSRHEIENLQIFSSEYDFFKLVQVGKMRTNLLDVPTFAKYCSILIRKVFIHDNTKMIVELNHDGNYFKSKFIESSDDLDPTHLFVKFKYNMKDEKSKAKRSGLMMNDELKSTACKLAADKVKYNQLVILDKITCNEAAQYSKNSSGRYEGMGKNDDAFCTQRNLALYFNTLSYKQQIEELMQFLPKDFFKLISEKLDRKIALEDYVNVT